MNALVPSFERLVLYDGVCAVCDRTVQFILDHDPEGRFHFAALDSDIARRVLARHPEIPEDLDSIIVIERLPDGSERASWHTTATLRIAESLPAPWRWARAGLLVPRVLRDPFYKGFAAVRYRVFGRLDSCRIPEPEWESRFLG